MLIIYVKVRVSTFQSQTIRHWEKHQRWLCSPANPAACQAVPVSAEHIGLFINGPR